VIERHGSSNWNATSEFAASKLVDQNENSYFHPAAEPSPWISIDFKRSRVFPTNDIFFSRKGAHYRTLQSWIREGSETGTEGP
jgi:hypothetical protein